ncbi:MAG: hypothetical protein OEZ01_09470 [Candidatus Heimdallarchaeota archaeon]|nr:hypothetical protein [Candidatus Heimdallarchaeota archaeon]MDH5646225.1 hypothetical protein [Candidatus Heimdallarchaeota archaeon]
MLLKTIQLIGKHIVGDLSPIMILVDTRPEYKSKYILTVTLDPFQKSLDQTEIQLEEYDPNKKYQYMRGTVGAGSNSHSPTSNFNLNKLKEFDLKKIKEDIASYKFNDWVNFITTDTGEKLFNSVLKKAIKIEQDLIKSLNKEPLQNRADDCLEKSLYLWLQQFEVEITVKILLFLIEQSIVSIDKNNSKFSVIRDAPGMLVFKIKKSSNVYYPGELDDFKKLFLDFNDDQINKLTYPSTCYTCNNETKYLLQPNIGIFNLDMRGFSQGFANNRTDSTQFSLCTECNYDISKGIDYIDKYLNFYAYRTKKGVYTKDGAYINHYLIPVVQDKELLDKTIKNIRKAKETIGDKTKKSIKSEIELLQSKIKRSDKAKSSALKKQLKFLQDKDKKSKEELGSNADLMELIKEISRNSITFIDLYYYVTDNKQTPPTKEIIGSYQVSDIALNNIANTITEVEKEGNVFQFYKINNIVKYKLFLSILDSLYQQSSIKKESFFKQSNDIIYESYQNYLLGQNKDLVPHFLLLNNFKLTHKFLELNNILV